MMTPVWSTTATSTSVSFGRGRFSFTSWMMPAMVAIWPMAASATVRTALMSM